MHPRHKQKGFAMMEVMLALMLSLILVGGASLLFGQGLTIVGGLRFSSAIKELSENIESAFGTRSNYTGLDFDTAVALGLVPPEIQNQPTSDGATITVSPYGAINEHFEIAISFDDADVAYPWCLSLADNTKHFWSESGPVSHVGDSASIASLASDCEGSTKIILRR